MRTLTGLDASTLYGTTPLGASAVAPAPTAHLAYAREDNPGGWRALVDPHNPLFWFGVVLAVTFGAAGVSGSAKAGPLKASASVGDTK